MNKVVQIYPAGELKQSKHTSLVVTSTLSDEHLLRLAEFLLRRAQRTQDAGGWKGDRRKTA